MLKRPMKNQGEIKQSEEVKVHPIVKSTQDAWPEYH